MLTLIHIKMHTFSCKSQSAKLGWAQVHARRTSQTLTHVLRRTRHVDDLAFGWMSSRLSTQHPNYTNNSLAVRWLQNHTGRKTCFAYDTSQDQHSHQEMISDWSDTNPPWRVHSIGDACKLQRGEQSPANISHVLLTDIKRRFLDAHSSWTGALPECSQPQLSVWMVVNQSSSIHEWSRVMYHNRREVNF